MQTGVTSAYTETTIRVIVQMVVPRCHSTRLATLVFRQTLLRYYLCLAHKISWRCSCAKTIQNTTETF